MKEKERKKLASSILLLRIRSNHYHSIFAVFHAQCNNILSQVQKRALSANVPINSKTAHPPGQSPGIWLALSSVQWGIWPKMRPTRWGIWLSYQNVCQRLETRRISQFFDSAREPRPRGFFFCCRFIVISWNIPLFKVWSEDKLNKKFVVAENFAELVSKGKSFCLYSFVSWVHGVTVWAIWPSLKL